MFACLPLGHCHAFNTVFQYPEHQGELLFQVCENADVFELVALPVELDVSFMQDACHIHLPFGYHILLT